LSSNINKIGNYAFKDCNALISLGDAFTLDTQENQVTSIGIEAFNNIKGI
jgi:hypothetical protein